MSFTRFLSILLITFSLTSHAVAAPLTFDFLGRVTYSANVLSGTQVGTIFSGSFTYDPSIPAYFDTGSLAVYDFGDNSNMTISISGNTIYGNRLSGYVQNEFNGNIDDSVLFTTGYPLLVNNTSYEQGSFGFEFATSYLFPSAFSDTKAPTYFNLSAFDVRNGWVQKNGGQLGEIFYFTIDSIINPVAAPVPEPESYAMMLVGLCLMGFVARRRMS